AALSLVHARYAALGIADSSGSGWSEFITIGLTPEEAAVIGPHPLERGILGLLLQADRPLRIDRLAAHPASVGFPSNHPQRNRFLGVPIRRAGAILGSLYLVDREDGQPFTEADEAVIVALAEYAAVALHFQEIFTLQRALTQGFINALEEERRAVAYELHDGLTQYVMTSHLYLDAFCEAYKASHTQGLPELLENALQCLRQAVLESRRLVNGLRSLALDAMGLVGVLEQLVGEEARRSGWTEIDFQHNITDRRFEVALETAVYRVAQEALTNIRKHAAATRVQVVLQWEDTPSAPGAQLILEVRDWGMGFDVERKRGNYDHLGLNSMVERVVLMQGTLEIESAPGQGTHLVARFPVPGARTSEVETS
ncbi:MAG TPA: GAF domain-containing protein, partial [Chthonomonadaceae bacterium]|nr:GAF domain-containing protein [Chthonomonadaceae bacterium]